MLRTKMTSNLIERGARWWRLALLLLALGLAACGPGTGGTGTGPLSYGFSGASNGAVFAPSAGLGGGCDRICQVNLQLQEQRVEFEASCTRFVAVGPWTLDANRQLVLNGTVERVTAQGIVSGPGKLQLAFSGLDVATSSQVTITLFNGVGTALLGPIQLRNDPGAAAGTAPQPSCSPV